MWGLYILGVAIVLIIDYVIAKKFADIAEMKGHEGKTYFWFTFLFSVVGMLMVFSLPNITESKASNTSLDSSPTQFANALKNASNAQQKTVKRCPYCGDIVKLGRCTLCGKEMK